MQVVTWNWWHVADLGYKHTNCDILIMCCSHEGSFWQYGWSEFRGRGWWQRTASLLEVPPGGPKAEDAEGGASVAFLILQPPRPLLAPPLGGAPKPSDLSVSGLIWNGCVINEWSLFPFIITVVCIFWHALSLPVGTCPLRFSLCGIHSHKLGIIACYADWKRHSFHASFLSQRKGNVVRQSVHTCFLWGILFNSSMYYIRCIIHSRSSAWQDGTERHKTREASLSLFWRPKAIKALCNCRT